MVATRIAASMDKLSLRFAKRALNFHAVASFSNRSSFTALTQCRAIIQYVFDGLPSFPVMVRRQSFVFNNSNSSLGHAFKIVPAEQSK